MLYLQNMDEMDRKCEKLQPSLVTVSIPFFPFHVAIFFPPCSTFDFDILESFFKFIAFLSKFISVYFQKLMKNYSNRKTSSLSLQLEYFCSSVTRFPSQCLARLICIHKVSAEEYAKITDTEKLRKILALSTIMFLYMSKD